MDTEIARFKKWLLVNKKGIIKEITVKIYATPVYRLDKRGFFSPSCFFERNSLEAIEKDAEIPVISPITAINLLFCKAKV